jgi:tRNA-specific 2-thiouridylase
VSERVVVAMSGGVDSSVACLLMKEQGYDCVGLFLKNGISAGPNASHFKQGCCSVEDAGDARRVAEHLGVPFYALDYGDDFGRLIDHFVDEYAAGRTPSPCVHCNTWLKFGKLTAFAQSLGAVAVVTGHYAQRVELPGGRFGLRRAADEAKDQTYFLASLSQEQLRWARFPLAAMTKDEVRDRAEAAGLRTARKPESMEICFVPDGDYRKVLEEHRPGTFREGEIVDHETGRVVGTHQGYPGFTVGQRRGLGVAAGHPIYVTEIEPATNRVKVGPKNLLARSRLLGERMTWVSVECPEGPIRCRAQVRHRSEPRLATATPLPGAEVDVALDDSVDAIAPGQALALYAEDEDLVLAGGWIQK